MVVNPTSVPTKAGPANQENPPNPLPRATKPERRFLSSLSTTLGLLFLGYVLGATVMFFELPSAGFLTKAFIGARAWNERRQSPTPGRNEPSLPLGLIDHPEKTFDGFTLYSCASQTMPNNQVFLINMRQEIVHRWTVSFRKIWPVPSHLAGLTVTDSLVCVFAGHLYPNGDLLVVFHGLERDSVGYGLAKLDKDSNVLWRYSASVHHDIDVGEDGTIYTLSQSRVYDRPKGLESIPPPWLVDHLVVLSAEGKELKKISILDAFWNSPYAPLLSPLETPRQWSPPQGMNMPRALDLRKQQDVLHTNTVKVLSRALAPKFPLFKAGQVLISLRTQDTIGIMDPDSGSIVWATRGPWRAQHDPHFLDNGRLLIFDNLGSPRSSRVLEYDPRTQSFPWSYPDDDHPPFFTSERGMSQRLPNGNTLIVNSEGRQLLEVTPSKEVVWSCSTYGFLCTGRRYSPDQVPFLKGGQRARP
jgi:hypothetical protein